MNGYNLKFKPGTLKSLLEQASGAGGGMGAGGGITHPDPLGNTTWDKVKNVAGQLGYASKAATASALMGTPPKEVMAATTGRLGGLGFSNQGIEDRMKYYKAAIGAVNPMQTAANAVAIGAGIGANIPGIGKLLAQPLTGAASIAQQWASATTEEPAKLMTAALYDPRSLGKMK
jgi:hypothetical protein